MSQQLPAAEQYQRFLSWQCRLRKMSVREQGGRPSTGMSAGVYSISGGEEKSRMNFLIVKQDPELVTSELRHLIRKSRDPSDWVKNGLRILSERHYQDDKEFSNDLTALFSLDSSLAEALITASQCRLEFRQDSIEYAFNFKVSQLGNEDSRFQATYWHNHLFNSALPGQVSVLKFSPLLEDG